MKPRIRQYIEIQAMGEHRSGKRRAVVNDWRLPPHQPLQRINVPNPGDPTRQLVALKILGYLLFLIGCCLMAWAWPTDAVQTFLSAMRSQP